jgi:hypothetical protein
MTTEVTLTLPENLIEHANRLGSATQRDLGTVLTDTLEMMWLTVDELPSIEQQNPIAALTDNEVLSLSDAKMDQTQNQRLGDLQAKGKSTKLTEAERYELLALLHIYQLGQLRKSEALAEAVKRGLLEPLSA